MPRPVKHLIETGTTYGEWTVIGDGDKDKRNRSTIRVQCSCGQVADKLRNPLVSGQTLSCGHGGRTYRKHPRVHVGDVFGEWTVVSQAASGANGNKRWNVQCSCGTSLVKTGAALALGHSTKCKQHTLGYSTAHAWVRKAKGSAADHECVDCGGAAKEWSFKHDECESPLIEKSDSSPLGCAYSLDVDDYDPRCKQCHVKFDSPEGK